MRGLCLADEDERGNKKRQGDQRSLLSLRADNLDAVLLEHKHEKHNK